MTRPGLRATVERSADPAAVKVALARLTEAEPERELRLEEDAPLREALVAVLAARAGSSGQVNQPAGPLRRPVSHLGS